ncbi:MAG: hypothetical protein R2736_22395 [Solirubrobacterales bacterium]
MARHRCRRGTVAGRGLDRARRADGRARGDQAADPQPSRARAGSWTGWCACARARPPSRSCAGSTRPSTWRASRRSPPARRRGRLDAWVGRGSYDIARLAAGGVLVAVEAVLEGRVDNAYALVRPPGHHAVAGEGKGFCLFNNLVVAAHHVRAQAAVGRIAIVDWDVHHGNGAQSAFFDDPDTLTISLHQDNVFPPDSGHVDETGVGTNVNVVLPPGCGTGAYRDAFARVVLPALRSFRPQLILVACGFDAACQDPLGAMILPPSEFANLTRMTMEAAADCCGGRLVLAHEGGYSTAVTPFCGLATIEQLAGERTPVEDPYSGPFTAMGGQELASHQAAAVDRAAALVAGLG